MAVLAAASGCAGNFRAPLGQFRQRLPPRYAQINAPSPEAPAPEQLGNWWRQFDSNDLDDLLNEVLRQNLDIRSALARVEQADARAMEAQSALWPLLSLRGATNRTRTNVRAFTSAFTGGDFANTGVASVTTTRYGVSAPVSYELDIWGRIRKTAEAAEREALASEAELAALLMTLSADTVESYFLGVELCAQRELLDKTIAAEQNFHDLVQKRYIDGIIDALDVYQAMQNLAARRAERPEFERQLIEVQNRLQILAGSYPEHLDRCRDVPELPSNLEPLPPGIPASLLKRRPDLRSLLLQLEASDARYAAAVRSRLPSVQLTGSGGYEALELSELFRAETFVWSLLGEIGLTVFDGGAKRARVELAEAQSAELLARYLQQSLEAFSEVENALSGERYSERRVALLEDKVEAVRRTLRLSTEQYLQGVKDYLPVLLAQGAFYQAQRELISARRMLISQRVQLARALGGSWSVKDGARPISTQREYRQHTAPDPNSGSAARFRTDEAGCTAGECGVS